MSKKEKKHIDRTNFCWIITVAVIVLSFAAYLLLDRLTEYGDMTLYIAVAADVVIIAGLWIVYKVAFLDAEKSFTNDE